MCSPGGAVCTLVEEKEEEGGTAYKGSYELQPSSSSIIRTIVSLVMRCPSLAVAHKRKVTRMDCQTSHCIGRFSSIFHPLPFTKTLPKMPPIIIMFGAIQTAACRSCRWFGGTTRGQDKPTPSDGRLRRSFTPSCSRRASRGANPLASWLPMGRLKPPIHSFQKASSGLLLSA